MPIEAIKLFEDKKPMEPEDILDLLLEQKNREHCLNLLVDDEDLLPDDLEDLRSGGSEARGGGGCRADPKAGKRREG